MTVHIAARPGAVADTVLLPGDPLRAKFVAERYLQDVEQYNQVRGMLGYTGWYRGRRVSVQGTGMGMPSACIYIHELIQEYGAKNLIRIGSAGSLQAHVRVRDVVLAMAASTDSAIVRQRFPGATYAPTVSYELFTKALAAARACGVAVKAGNVFSADQFYHQDPDNWQRWARYGVLCAEMETAGIYTLAAQHGVHALTLLTISDSLPTGEFMTPDERERSLTDMIEVALGILEQ